MRDSTEVLAAPSAIPASPAAALETVTVHPEGSEAASDAKLQENRARDEKGRYAAAKDARETAEKRGEDALKKEFPDLFNKGQGVEQPVAEPAKAAATGSAVQAEDDPSPRQLGRADSILQRAKISQARIEKMSPRERVELARELKPLVIERQQENQRATDPGFADKTIATNGKAGSPAGEPHDTPSPVVADLIEKAKADFGPELAATLDGLMKAAVGPLQAELSARKAEQARTEQQRQTDAIKAAREALVERFPELEDDESFFEDVAPVMGGLYGTGRYDLSDPKQAQKLVLTAARAAELNEVGPQADAEKEQLARLTRNGTATSRSKAAPYTGKTKDERISLAAKLALDPTISVEDARRRVYGS